MRFDNGWIRTVAAVALGGGLCITTTAAQPQDAGTYTTTADADGGTLPKMAEHIEIMRVVLTNAINDGAFAEQYRKDLEAAKNATRKRLAEELRQSDNGPAEAPPAPEEPAALYRSLALENFGLSRSKTFTSHTRGFYASGVGALFTTEVSTPVREVAVQQVEDAAEHDDADDAWARAQQEVRGGGRFNTTFGAVEFMSDDDERKNTRWEIDPEYVQLAIDSVIEVAAKHGLRLEGLGDDESIIVATRFSASRLGLTVPSVATRSDDHDDNGKAAAAPSVYTLVSASQLSRRAADVNVVIEVPKSVLQQLDSGAISMDELRERITITRYAKAGRRVSQFSVIAPAAR